jgi:hypothetical protein
VEATEDEAVGDVLGMFCRRADDAEDTKGEVEVGAKTDVMDSVLKIDSEADKTPDATVEGKSLSLLILIRRLALKVQYKPHARKIPAITCWKFRYI